MTHRKVYIWQHEDWPHLTFDAALLMPKLARIHHRMGELDGMMAMIGLSDRDEARLGAMSEEIERSWEIEGVAINAKSLRSSIARRLGMENDYAGTSDDHFTEGIVDVMTDALTNCLVPLTAERLMGWHAALFPTGHSGRYRIAVGQWREGDEPMQVVSGAMGHERVHFEAPPSADVDRQMQMFLQWASDTDVDAVAAAAMAHLWFVTIHPFDDGNGRISRTISDYFLSRADVANGRFYSMSAAILRNRKDYYAMLESAQKGGLDITPWVEWFVGCLDEALTQAMTSVTRIVAKARYWETHRGAEINERQRKIVNRLWDGFDGKLTTSKWAKMCKCSQDTALRDIRHLVEAGMLRHGDGSGRSTHYVLNCGDDGCNPVARDNN